MILCFTRKHEYQKGFMTYWCGVSLQLAVNLAQVEQLRLLHVTGLCPGSVQDRCSMALEIKKKSL